ncbi:MAG TPA: DUF3024 domain-containing protein [Nitrospirae bacterium]|nr:hypothetical protein BMS3Abin10_01659 [bacterium BMS3Abin10]GBE38587.1 hypothetical protein BMS3Bbin08_01194 [bacterium BMS3Bbin08]HDO25224.1 DUF3024 domain-containing protein [Nitrospirota bacterium]HDZ03266.1 DUF3024 domain-containing protein [Nitrospirota bacterium]
MPLPTLVKTLAEKKVGGFCRKRVPPHVLDKVNLSYKIRGNSVTVFENRAPWHPDMKEWTSMSVAQMRFNEKTGEWTLFCADRNDKWHKYYDMESTKNIDKILTEIDKDPTGIFWG